MRDGRAGPSAPCAAGARAIKMPRAPLSVLRTRARCGSCRREPGVAPARLVVFSAGCRCASKLVRDPQLVPLRTERLNAGAALAADAPIAVLLVVVDLGVDGPLGRDLH